MSERKRTRASTRAAPSSKKAKNSREEEEVRGAPFVARPSSQVQDRIDRAFHHRLFLIKRIRRKDACDFRVLGATGNIYTVTLKKRAVCTCPDFGRCYTCKHVLFIMLRVLKLPRDDPRVWQKALLSSEVNDLLSRSDSVEASVLASSRVREKLEELESGKRSKEAEKTEEKSDKQRPVEGDCPVCYEPMETGGEAVVFCNTCGNNVHKECFQRWSQSKASSSANVTCIYCRAVWDNKEARKAEVVKRGGYINLASFSEHHRPEEVTMAALYPDSYRARNGYYGYGDDDEDDPFEAEGGRRWERERYGDDGNDGGSIPDEGDEDDEELEDEAEEEADDHDEDYLGDED